VAARPKREGSAGVAPNRNSARRLGSYSATSIL
jgi:hypothetical protein